MLKRFLTGILLLFFIFQNVVASDKTIEIRASGKADNRILKEALEQAAAYKGKKVTLKMLPGIYNFCRQESEKVPYYISNTASEKEDPDPTKHIAALLKGQKNLTIDGCGSTWLMTGEMTSFVIDSCENITLKNINIDFQHHTQTEMEVVENGEDYLVVRVHPASQYRITDGKLIWYGDGWEFSEGLAPQSYDRVRGTTWRSWNPMKNLKKVVELAPHLLYLQYEQKRDIALNTVFQMRDAIRDEVCGFINRSRDVVLENMNFYFLGNFGIVCQFSENVTFTHSNFAPKPGSGRTNAGYADFIQVSGCKGKINILNSNFSGAHDDAINIHGTYLTVTEYMGPKTVKVRFMHHQSFGFKAFYPKDEIDLVDAETLLPLMHAKVQESELVNTREMVVTLNREIPESIRKIKRIVMENISYTPEVLVRGNRFSQTPTHGLLIATPQKAVVEENIFYGLRAGGVLLGVEPVNWCESGPVKDMTIRRNTFIDCKGPGVIINPSYKRFDGTIHNNVRIVENTFDSQNSTSPAIRARAAGNLYIGNNFFNMKHKEHLIDTADCRNVVIEGNGVGK